MDDKTATTIRYWKTHRYIPQHLPFVDAVYSLLTDSPLIELKQVPTNPAEWIICLAGTTTPAQMTYAGVFAESDPYDTGNLVWASNPRPPNMEESHVAQHAGVKAAYSYTIETYHDREIWDLQKTLDEYVKSVEGFNKKGNPRLRYQDGDIHLPRFTFRTPMFFPFNSGGKRPRLPERLHAWVKAAHARGKFYRANPNPPRVRAIERGEIRDIAACEVKKLEYGDVVGLVFSIHYVESPEHWAPVYHLYDIIRVMFANRDTYPLQEPVDEEAEEIFDRPFSIAGAQGVIPALHAASLASVSAVDSAADTTLFATPPSVTVAPQVGPLSVSAAAIEPAHSTPVPSSSPPKDPAHPTQGSATAIANSDMEIDEEETGSSATEGTVDSMEPISVQGATSADQEPPPFKRRVRPRLDDDPDDIRMESDGPVDALATRPRRTGAVKARRGN